MLSDAAKIIRRTGIGSSDIAGILGHSPYTTPAQIYKEKVDGFEKEISPHLQAIFDHGNRSEAIIANLYSQVVNLEVYTSDTTKLCSAPTAYIDLDRKSAIYRHPEYDYLIASPDRFVVNKVTWETFGLEIKTASLSAIDTNLWGLAGSTTIPKHYYVQIQHCMLVTGMKRWDVAVKFGDLVKDGKEELRIYTFMYDEEVGQHIIDAATNFWKNHVCEGFAPPVDHNNPSALKFLKQIYSTSNSNTIALPGEYIAIADDLMETQLAMRKITATQQQKLAVILDAMGENSIATLPDGRQFQRHIDSKGVQTLNVSCIDKDNDLINGDEK